MIDEPTKAAMVLVVAFLVKLAFEAAGFPLNDEMYFTLAGIIVTLLLALFGYNLLKAGVRRLNARLAAKLFK